MRTLQRIGLSLVACMGLAAQDTLPPEARYSAPDVPVDYRSLKIGETVCGGPIAASVEHHVWLSPKDFHRSRDCLSNVTRTRTGWKIELHFPIAEIDTDATFKRLGYIRMTQVIPPPKRWLDPAPAVIPPKD